MIKLLSSFCHLDQAQIAGEARSDELPIASAFHTAAAAWCFCCCCSTKEGERDSWWVHGRKLKVLVSKEKKWKKMDQEKERKKKPKKGCKWSWREERKEIGKLPNKSSKFYYFLNKLYSWSLHFYLTFWEIIIIKVNKFTTTQSK